jgi:endonuclease-3
MLAKLKRISRQWAVPTVTEVAETTHDPFKVLISTVLSARTKDETTAHASQRLFKLGSTPEAMRKIPAKKIEKAIFPVGFYRTKARNIRELSRTLIHRYGGRVPDSMEDLLTLQGVGRKTANLVITLAFRKHGICVDTHVHRISNRWGLVRTRAPKETEFALYKILPRRYWISYNDLLVAFGQNVCKPISPFCSACPIGEYCPRIGVTHHR